jgi:hypothetical protein
MSFFENCFALSIEIAYAAKQQQDALKLPSRQHANGSLNK